MEGRLFLISMWCGLYGQILRFVFRRDESSPNIWITVLLNSFFWGTVGILAGMLRAGYLKGPEYEANFSLSFAVGGMVLGAILGFWRGRQDERRDVMLRDNLEWADTGFSAILLASFFMFFIVQAFKIPSGSMRMTFVEGDHLFVNKFIYGLPVPFTKKKVIEIKSVNNEEIVIFRFPSEDDSNPHHGKDFIKRVIAVEGQTVEIKDKKLIIDGQIKEEEYKQHVDERVYPNRYDLTQEDFQNRWEKGEFAPFGGNDIRDNFGPVTVPADHVMVMGDNRDRSFDSRFWGPLPIQEIKGKAWLLYWPFKRFRVVHK